MNIRTLNNGQFGPYEDVSFGDMLDQGLINEVRIASIPFYANYYIRDYIYDNYIINPGTELPMGTEYLQFSFINEYGAYDYYTVFNPLRRQTNASKDTVSKPRVI